MYILPASVCMLKKPSDVTTDINHDFKSLKANSKHLNIVLSSEQRFETYVKWFETFEQWIEMFGLI